MASARSGISFVVLLVGCAVGPGSTGNFHDAGQDAPMRIDAGLATQDAGPDAAIDDGGAPRDGGTDAASVDAANVDANDHDGGSDASHDAATITPPVVDGVVGATEWAAATSASSTTVTLWAGNELRALHAIAIGGTLYLAIEGQVQANNGMLVYLDGDPGGSHGVANLASLTDSIGALDNAISAGFTTPAAFRADVAFGTTIMSHLVSGADDTTGFRDIAANGADFAWLSGTQTACTAAACEASIATSALGPGPAPRTIQLFARIAQPDGMASPNQTLPMDDATNPRVVMVVMSIHE